MQVVWIIFCVFFFMKLVSPLPQCSSNCSAISLHSYLNTLHTVPCSVQSRMCSKLQNSSETSTKPDFEGKHWFLYSDPENKGFDKIGLNFSWSPGDDYSIVKLVGYQITLNNYDTSISKKKYFCFANKLDFEQHVKAVFHYNCMDDFIINPKDFIVVTIRSLPIPKEHLNDPALVLNFTIPSCKNPIMKNVFECQKQNLLKVSVRNLSCKNRSATVSYSVSPHYGNSAEFFLGKVIGLHGLSTTIKHWDNQSLNQTIQIYIPMDYSLQNNFSFNVWGNKLPQHRHFQAFNFAHCLDQGQFQISTLLIFILVGFFSVFAICFFAIYKLLYKKKLKHIIQKNFNSISDSVNKDKSTKFTCEVTAPVIPLSANRTKVYIVFVDDHPYHKEIILSFSSFLEGDLGFDVVLELYQTNEVYADPVGWMEKSLAECDKVIVIWSPLAAERWCLYKNKSTFEDDFFLPILKNIHKDLFRSKNVLKYIFVYFDYCSKDDIPFDFRKIYSHLHFKLMQQMEDLYFRLKDMEKYAPGTIIKPTKVDFQSYFDFKVNRFGQNLHFQIRKMCEYVKENPFWYKEQNINQKHNFSNTSNVLSMSSCNEIKQVCFDVIPPDIIVLQDKNNCTNEIFEKDRKDVENSLVASGLPVINNDDKKDYNNGSVQFKSLQSHSIDCYSQDTSSTSVATPKTSIKVENISHTNPVDLIEEGLSEEKPYYSSCTLNSFYQDIKYALDKGSFSTEKGNLSKYYHKPVICTTNNNFLLVNDCIPASSVTRSTKTIKEKNSPNCTNYINDVKSTSCSNSTSSNLFEEKLSELPMLSLQSKLQEKHTINANIVNNFNSSPYSNHRLKYLSEKNLNKLCTPVVALAPIDLEKDPKVSLMTINGF